MFPTQAQTKKFFARTVITGIFSLAITAVAHAHGDWANNPEWQTCATSAGVTTGQRPDQAQRQQIRSCMHTARKAAFATCAQENGVTVPTPATAAPTDAATEHGNWQRPERAEWQKMKACMKTAGFPMWHHHHHHHHGQSQQAGGTAPTGTTAPAASTGL